MEPPRPSLQAPPTEKFTDDYCTGMLDSWIFIEDEKEVLDAISEEEIEEFKSCDAKPAAMMMLMMMMSPT